jgi:hypothetical protein
LSRIRLDREVESACAGSPRTLAWITPPSTTTSPHWRASLTAVADLARREGALDPLITPETAAELIISTVKGASLNAATARDVCGGLAALLTGAGGTS